MKTILNVKNENQLKQIQRILLNQMNRLDDDEIMKERSKKEIMRSGALSQSSSQYIKSVITQLKVLEMSGKYNAEVKDMNKYLGIDNSEL